jgi:small-conductance mechanosensitive channel
VTPAKLLKQVSRLAWPIVTIAAMLALRSHRFQTVTWLPNSTLEKTTACVIFLASALLASRAVTLLLEKRVRKQKRPKLLKEVTSSLLFLAATVASASVYFGDSASSVLAGSGLIIAVIGFAIRNVVADVLTGIAFGLEAPFRIGDWVDFEGATKGQVVEIGWRSTRVLTRDATYMILPNSQVARQRLTNYSAPRRHYRSQVSVVLDHCVDVSLAKRVLLKGALAADAALKDPPPDVRAIALSLEGIVYSVRFWVPNFAQDIDCRDDILVSVDHALREAAIARPYRSAGTGTSWHPNNDPLEQENENAIKRAA